MCGIAGILSAEAPVDTFGRDALVCLQDSLGHRGPDDRGVFVSPDRRAAFVHTRLSILDLSPAGHQPMPSDDGRYWVTYNGEIYNFRELRCAMQCDGETFRTGTDTEVLLRLYAREGPGCVTRLRGMFAFAIWDAAEGTCFLARDLFGIKPVYYYSTGDRLLFASELSALMKTGLVPRRLNPAGVAGYFRSGTVPEPDTLVQDVHCLRAGHALLWKAGHVREWQHSLLGFSDGPADDVAAVVQDVRAALQDSVEHHFVSDVPVGIFLSGGIDSTALLALASQGSRRDIRTFSIRFREKALDEGDLARRTAAHFGSRHSEWQVDADIGRGLFRQFLERMDRPTIDGFNTFVVSKFAHDAGMKVVLSGVGGDELFGGYPSFRDVPRMLQMRRPYPRVVQRVAGAALERWAHKPTWRRLGQFLSGDGTLPSAYQAYRGIFLDAEANRMALGYTGSLPAAWFNDNGSSTKQSTTGDEVSLLELSLYMRNQLLRDSDVMSMAWGLELRVPFLDQELFAHLARVPAALRLQPGKKLLLDAVPEIPSWVATQPKRGFVFPFAEWFGGEWETMFRESASRFGVTTRTWYQKWAIFVFEDWCRRHGVR